MTNKKSTKRALLLSVLSLVLCFSMLVGTTFAWFTDSVTSANNIIKSGNLDIELEYYTADGWKTVENASNILTNTLWEPGVVEVAYLRVANAGSLALKYQLGINIVSETEGKNAAGDSFKLSDYIMFGVVEGIEFDAETKAPKTYANRDDAVAAVSEEKKISAGYTKASSMAPEAELYLALVVYMPTTVGNEANHDGTNVPEINLGINVVATQVENEEDAFGTDYDNDAALPEVSVSTNKKENASAIVNTSDVSIDVPADAPAGDYKIEVSNKKEATDDEGNTTVAMDITLTKDGEKVTADGTTIYTVSVEIGTNKTVTAVTHNGEAITDYEYDASTGIVTFEKDSFSPFTITYIDKPALDMSKVSSVLKENDWETIHAVIEAGKVEEAGWKVGDVSPDFTINDLTRNAILIGVNQDGENTATFMIVERVGASKMRERWTNEGGYGETIVSSMLDEMESTVSIADYMVTVNKSYYYEVFSNDNYKVGVDSGKLFLLSLEEVGMMDEAEGYGYRYLDVLDQESSFVYTYFQTNDADKRGDFYWETKYNQGDFWLRSSETDSTVGFFAFDRYGDFGGGSANVTNDILPAFVIG